MTSTTSSAAILGYAEMALGRLRRGQPGMAACAGGEEGGRAGEGRRRSDPRLQPPHRATAPPGTHAPVARGDRRPAERLAAPDGRPSDAPAGRGCHRAGRAEPAAAGGHEPLHQRRAGHGRRGRHRCRPRPGRARHRAGAVPRRSRRRSICPSDRARQRSRHGRGDPGADLRALLHDQGGRHGNRARARHGPRHRLRSRWRDGRPQQAGGRQQLRGLFPASRSSAGRR